MTHGRRATSRHAAAQDHRDRHRARAGGPAAVPAPHRSRTTCAWAPSSRRRARSSPSGSTTSTTLFPRLKERRAPARRHHVGRRAADVRHRPRADERAEAGAARRAVDGARAGDRRAGVRPGAAHPRRGLHGADRRAERAPGAEGRRPRLPARGRPHQGARHRRTSSPPATRSARRTWGFRWAVRIGILRWIASSTSSSSRRSSTACCSAACWRCWRSAST